MGFFQDLKQDLSQTVNDLEAEDTAVELNLDDEGAAAPEDLYGRASDTDFSDLEAMLEEKAAALGDAPADTAAPRTESEADTTVPDGADYTAAAGETVPAEPEPYTGLAAEDTPAVTPEAESGAGTETQVSEENNISEADTGMEQLLNEAGQNVEEPAYTDAAPAAPQADSEAGVTASTDTAVITAGMSITGDVTSSGNMDLIGNITGNIEILGKLNVTGNITGNSSAAEIYAESAQINGDMKSKGSVKIGQSSVVIGNIFATSAVIAGAVNGDIDVHGPVILDASAIVMGNIKSRSVQINNGAVIEGMCSQCYADISPASFFDDFKKNKKA